MLGLLVGLAVCAQQRPGTETHGLGARAAAGEYQAQAAMGNITIAADFVGHSIPTAEGPLSSEDYVAVEVAFFGPADGKVTLSFEHFSLRINGKKALASQPYGLMMRSLSDPEWIPETPAEGPKSKGGLSSGGGGGSDPKPPPPVMPFPLRRAMELKARKSALPEGERAVPVAGLVIFQYRGKDQSIQSAELIYEGPAGKATLNFPR